MSCEDQALGHTTVCILFKCQTWQDNKIIKPTLVQDDDGFWCCPKCKVSYGKDAVAPENSENNQERINHLKGSWIQIVPVGKSYYEYVLYSGTHRIMNSIKSWPLEAQARRAANKTAENLRVYVVKKLGKPAEIPL